MFFPIQPFETEEHHSKPENHLSSREGGQEQINQNSNSPESNRKEGDLIMSPVGSPHEQLGEKLLGENSQKEAEADEIIIQQDIEPEKPSQKNKTGRSGATAALGKIACILTEDEMIKDHFQRLKCWKEKMVDRIYELEENERFLLGGFDPDHIEANQESEMVHRELGKLVKTRTGSLII